MKTLLIKSWDGREFSIFTGENTYQAMIRVIRNYIDVLTGPDEDLPYFYDKFEYFCKKRQLTEDTVPVLNSDDMDELYIIMDLFLSHFNNESVEVMDEDEAYYMMGKPVSRVVYTYLDGDRWERYGITPIRAIIHLINDLIDDDYGKDWEELKKVEESAREIIDYLEKDKPKEVQQITQTLKTLAEEMCLIRGIEIEWYLD